MAVEWAGRRQDIIEALRVFAAPDAAASARYPSLTDAVHWLIDDTWWDQRDPAGDIGLLLNDVAEAQAIKDVLEPALSVLRDLGPTALDAAYVRHPRWSEVAAAAVVCLRQFGALGA